MLNRGDALRRAPLRQRGARAVSVGQAVRDLHRPRPPPQESTGDHIIPWRSEMQRMVDNLPEPRQPGPAIATCVVFTSVAAHYPGSEHAPPRGRLFWSRQVLD